VKVLSPVPFLSYNEFTMGIWAYRHLFSQIALLLAVLIVSVFFMHVFIVHDHEHESFRSGIVLPVHNATGEKFFALLLPSSLFIAFSTILSTRHIFLEMRLRRVKQQEDWVLPNMYLQLFARGILHSKKY
jgi:hypothetical protein